MESAPRQVLPGGDAKAQAGAVRVRWSGRRRRPTGQPPPLPRSIQPTGLWWAATAAALVALGRVAFGPARRTLGVTITVWDDAVVRWLGGLHLPGLTGLMEVVVASTGSAGVVAVLRWGTLIALLVLRRIRHLVVFVGSSVAVLLAVRLATVDRPRPFGVVIRGSWAGWAMPSRPIAIFAATLVGVLYTLVPPGRWRQLGKWIATGLVAAYALSRVYLGVDAPTDALVAAVLGVAVSVAAYRLFVPNEVYPVAYRRGRSAHLDVGGRRGQAIRHALADQLGLTAVEVEPFGQEYSAASTPLRIKVEGEAGTTSYMFGKLYARSHLLADRWYKLGRELLYGRLEDEKAFNTMRRLAQHEDYALRLLRDSGLPVPKPFGSVELTPEREYLLVTEFLEGAKEITDAEVDDTIIDEGLAVIRRLWEAGLAHRDIKPANLLVQGGHVRLIDTFLTEVHPSPWRQAVDLANMLLCLSLRSSPQRVYERALRQFSVEEIGEALAARQGGAMPSQLRQMMRAQGRDLHAEFLALLPERPRPISIQRWSVRRVGLLLLVLLALIPAIPMAWAFVQTSANPGIGARVSSGNGSCSRVEELWLEAQAVPSASRIPCVKAVPDGALGDLRVRDGESVLELSRASLTITFKSGDRPHASSEAGAVTIRFAAACEVQMRGQGQTVVPGVRRFQVNGSRGAPVVADVFPGGCLTYLPDPLFGATDPLLDQAEHAVAYRTRDDLRQALRAAPPTGLSLTRRPAEAPSRNNRPGMTSSSGHIT